MDSETITLRPATEADAEFAFDLKKAALGEYIRQTFGWDERDQRKLHERRFNPAATRIILASGREVGLVTLRDKEERMQLLQLFLLPTSQGMGIGSHVMAWVLGESHRRRRPVVLGVLKCNPRARTFYQRHGFAVVSETDTHHMMEAAC